MPNIPVRITANLQTRVDPVSQLPIVTLAFAMAERQPDGRLFGTGTRAIALDLAALYEEVSPATGEPSGVFITGEKILAALLGLAQAAQGG